MKHVKIGRDWLVETKVMPHHARLWEKVDQSFHRMRCIIRADELQGWSDSAQIELQQTGANTIGANGVGAKSVGDSSDVRRSSLEFRGARHLLPFLTRLR